MINKILDNIVAFYKGCNNLQILTSRESHHIIVGCFITFSLLLNIFIIPENLYNIIKIIVLLRLVDIHIHNMNVAFFDHYKQIDNTWHPIQNISSYKRIFILNLLVLLESIYYLKVFHNIYILIAFISAVFPTLVLFIRCFDYKLEQYFNHK